MKIAFQLIFLFPILLFGQINESDSLKLKSKLSITGVYQSGNVETWIFRAASDISYRPWSNWVFKTQNSYVYQEFGGTKADEDILSLNFLYFNPDRKVYPFTLAFISTNFRREIDIRSLFGAGATFQLLRHKNHKLKFSLSGEYERTRYVKTTFNETEYNGNENINTFRGTLWVHGKYKLFNNKIILSHESYFQPSLSQSNNFRWRADLNLEFPIWKYLNFKINYLQFFESVVIENQKQTDRFLTFGLTLKSHPNL